MTHVNMVKVHMGKEQRSINMVKFVHYTVYILKVLQLRKMHEYIYVKIVISSNTYLC